MTFGAKTVSYVSRGTGRHKISWCVFGGKNTLTGGSFREKYNLQSETHKSTLVWQEKQKISKVDFKSFCHAFFSFNLQYNKQFD